MEQEEGEVSPTMKSLGDTQRVEPLQEVKEEAEETRLFISVDEREGGKKPRRKGVKRQWEGKSPEEVEGEGGGRKLACDLKLDETLDRTLEDGAKQHNLTAVNVRNILHEVITNEHVVAMMKAAISETEDAPVFVNMVETDEEGVAPLESSTYNCSTDRSGRKPLQSYVETPHDQQATELMCTSVPTIKNDNKEKEVNELMEELFETFQDEIGFPNLEDDGLEDEEGTAEARPNFNTPQVLRFEEPLANLLNEQHRTVKEQLEQLRVKKSTIKLPQEMERSKLRNEKVAQTLALDAGQRKRLQQQMQQNELESFAQSSLVLSQPSSPAFQTSFQPFNLKESLQLIKDFHAHVKVEWSPRKAVKKNSTDFPKPLISKYLLTTKTAHQLTGRIKNRNMNRVPDNIIRASLPSIQEAIEQQQQRARAASQGPDADAKAGSESADPANPECPLRMPEGLQLILRPLSSRFCRRIWRWQRGSVRPPPNPSWSNRAAPVLHPAPVIFTVPAGTVKVLGLANGCNVLQPLSTTARAVSAPQSIPITTLLVNSTPFSCPLNQPMAASSPSALPLVVTSNSGSPSASALTKDAERSTLPVSKMAPGGDAPEPGKASPKTGPGEAGGPWLSELPSGVQAEPPVQGCVEGAEGRAAEVLGPAPFSPVTELADLVKVESDASKETPSPEAAPVPPNPSSEGSPTKGELLLRLGRGVEVEPASGRRKAPKEGHSQPGCQEEQEEEEEEQAATNPTGPQAAEGGSHASPANAGEEVGNRPEGMASAGQEGGGEKDGLEEEEEEDFDDYIQDEEDEMSSASEESVLSVPELQETMEKLTWLASERRLSQEGDSEEENSQEENSEPEEEEEEEEEGEGEPLETQQKEDEMADEVFEEQQAFEKSRTFLRRLEICFAENPSHHQKIIKLKNQMWQLLKGHDHLQDEFSVFFDHLRPSASRLGDFEEINWTEEKEYEVGSPIPSSSPSWEGEYIGTGVEVGGSAPPSWWEHTWSYRREADRVILTSCQERGADPQTFSAISEQLGNKTPEEVAHRFRELMTLFHTACDDSSDDDEDGMSASHADQLSDKDPILSEDEREETGF
ncbi:GON-4-like protein [Ophiophagus hannah]|uniref:GON-4-like protein n=1 Tax=Ophiophagus hannah TaxID=8665 RepID=V8NKZ7_OPHHA|nr:GON-4-like protein [Ophiophagus hannah]